MSEPEKRCKWCNLPLHRRGMSFLQWQHKQFCDVPCRTAYRRANPLPRARGPEHLSKRERETLQLFLDGFNWQQIGDELGISYKTVYTHAVRLRHRLHARNDVELVKAAIRAGFTTL